MSDLFVVMLAAGMLVAFIYGWRRHSRRYSNIPPPARNFFVSASIRFGWFVLFVVSLHAALACLIHAAVFVGIASGQAVGNLPPALAAPALVPTTAVLAVILPIVAGWSVRAWIKSYPVFRSRSRVRTTEPDSRA